MKLPNRSGKCWCGRPYIAGSTDVVRFDNRWQHLSCLPDTPAGRLAADRQRKFATQPSED